MSDLSKIYLFRITHIKNVPHILTHGITHANSNNSNKNYISIGDNSLINRRNNITISNGKRLGDYIPFYFGVRMPMLYVIQNGFNGITAIEPSEIVYCITNVRQILGHDLPFMFTNGHSVDGLTDFFNKKDIANINSIIDKKAIRSKYWRNENDLDLKRRKEAEFLIESDVPSSAIIGWAVYNTKAKTRMEEEGVSADKIIVKQGYYF